MAVFNLQRVMGEYFGYPKCCIDEWCASHPVFFYMRPEVQQEAERGGFIPCLKHSKEIVASKVTHEALIENRICSVPFPDQPSDREVDKYIASKLKGK